MYNESDLKYGHCSILFSTELILTVEISPKSVTISSNDQFTVTCTARAEVDGQGLPVEVLRWVRITNSSSGLMNFLKLDSTKYDITKTGSPESGYQSILTTTENDRVNMIIYRCRARISTNSANKNFSDVIVTIEGSHCIFLSLTFMIIKCKTFECRYSVIYRKHSYHQHFQK